MRNMEFAIDEKLYKAHAFDRIARVIEERDESHYLLSFDDEKAIIDIVSEVKELFATIAKFEQEIAEEGIIDAEN